MRGVCGVRFLVLCICYCIQFGISFYCKAASLWNFNLFYDWKLSNVWMTELNVWKEKLRTLLNLKPTNSQRLLVEIPHTLLIQKNTFEGNTRTIKYTRFCYTFWCLHFVRHTSEGNQWHTHSLSHSWSVKFKWLKSRRVRTMITVCLPNQVVLRGPFRAKVYSHWQKCERESELDSCAIYTQRYIHQK